MVTGLISAAKLNSLVLKQLYHGQLQTIRIYVCA